MKKVIIPQNPNRNIHDIASAHYDREIKFPKGAKFAVVLSDFYGGKGYTTYKSETATIQGNKRNALYSRQIIGVDGWIYFNDGDSLVTDYDQREPYEVQDFEEITRAASVLGSIKSKAKARAARENGRKGGRPRNES